jgi:hypothetical protein
MFILQCEVGIPNTLCPGTGTQSRGPGQDPGSLQKSARLDIGAVEIRPDGTLRAPIWLALGDRLLGAATVRLEFDPAAYKVEACTVDPAARMDGAMCHIDAATGEVRLTGLKTQGISGDLVLAEVTFRMAPAAPKGAAPVLKHSVLVDPAGRPIGGVIRFGVDK